MTEIRFLTNEAGKAEGLAYAGFETFRGSPYTSCARETGQNSRDAASGEGPVSVSFDLRHIERVNVPFADDLARSIRCCLDAPQNDKTKAHLERALATITDPVIKVLEISDTNTTGLTGPIDDPMSVFTALVKGDGITNKPDETSAGSFGIGKNAAYAVSDLQTVVYSTCYVDEETEEQKFAAQGRLRLISHTDGSKKFSAEGYWGNADFAAIEDVEQVPGWAARSEIGTSIFSIGFIELENWAGRMKLSLATNFFAAIDRGDIEFSVDGTKINRSTLDSVLEDTALEALAKETDQLAELERARRLRLCIRSDAATRETLSVPGLGDFTLHLLVQEGLPREVHVLRNGIYITDNFAKFSQPMRLFPGTREFTAVLEPARTAAGRGPSSLLKQLENPAHDAFEPERIADAAAREQAGKQIKKLIKDARAVIRRDAKIDEVQHSQLEELSELFADTGATRDEGRDDGEKDPDAYIYVKARRGARQRATGVGRKGKGHKRGGPGKQQKGSRTSQSKKTRKSMGSGAAVPLEGVRSTIENADPNKRTLWFTPSADGEIVLAIAAAGLAEDVELQINASSQGKAINGRVRATVQSAQRVRLDVTLSEPFDGPIELTATRFVEVPAQEAA